jgi:hypothetical protein
MCGIVPLSPHADTKIFRTLRKFFCLCAVTEKV